MLQFYWGEFLKNMCCNGKCWGGCWFHKISVILLFVGGINWGLVGLGMLMGGNWNLVSMLFGSWATVEAVVYLLVGVAAVMKLFGCRCSKCKAACASCSVSENTSNQI